MNPIILLHGALGSKLQLDPLKHLLEQQKRVVHSLNFSGHNGEAFSDEGFGIETFSHDVMAYINQHNLDKVDIFGYSMGGYVAFWLAHQQPFCVNRIITLGTKFDWSPESAAHEIKKLDPEKIESKVPAFARILQHRHAPNNWKELMHKTASMMSQLGESPLLTEEIFKSITQPITILLGDQDDMADRNYSEEVVSWLPNSEFHTLENTPHPIEKVKIEMLLKYFQ